MTRRGLMIRVSLAAFVYLVAIAVGVDLRFRFPGREDLHYVLYRDLVPLLIALPALWLAYAFRRRSSYLRQVRAAWPVASAAARRAIRSTRIGRPDPDELAGVVDDLDAAIDGVRTLFRPGRSDPAAPLAAIRDEVEALGSGEGATPDRAEAARSAIRRHWEDFAARLFDDFDRVRPGHPRARRD